MSRKKALKMNVDAFEALVRIGQGKNGTVPTSMRQPAGDSPDFSIRRLLRLAAFGGGLAKTKGMLLYAKLLRVCYL